MHVLPRKFDVLYVNFVALLVFNHSRTCNHKNSTCIASSMCNYYYYSSIVNAIDCSLLFHSILLHMCDLHTAVFRKDCSPGPGYFVDSTTTRFGTDGTPSYSILGRAKDPSEYSMCSFQKYILKAMLQYTILQCAMANTQLAISMHW